MFFYIKIAIVYIARFVLRVFYVFPVKENRIMFSAYEGISYTCNPKYIFQYIYEKDKGKWEYIWCLNKPDQLPEKYKEHTRVVSFLSIRHIYYLLTSRVIISNLGIEPIIPKRRTQVFINTWHGGGAYKRTQSDLGMFSQAESLYVKTMRDIRKRGTDYFISSCKAFSEVSSEGFNIDLQCFLPIGLPRNDMLINGGSELCNSLRKKIAEQYHLDTSKLWVLYAPTFRGTLRQQTNIDTQICNDKVLYSLQNRFKQDAIIITRAHTPHIYLESNNTSDMIVDLTDYPDMQELLAATDILITDYSSSIWDFALTKRPAFLYTPDLATYKNDRGFYTPIERWPYPYAEDMVSFCSLIEKYDAVKGGKKIQEHQKFLGSYETGTASEKIYHLISSL